MSIKIKLIPAKDRGKWFTRDLNVFIEKINDASDRNIK